MTPLAELVTDCGRLGIRLRVAKDGGLMIDAPEGALTPELIARLRVFKPALLALIEGRAPEGPGVDEQAAFKAVLDRLEREPDRPAADVMNALRAAQVRWINRDDSSSPKSDSETLATPLGRGKAGRSHWAMTGWKGDPKPGPEPVCPCGGTTWIDAPIHDGDSIRRDCNRCGRLIGFPIWHGRPGKIIPREHNRGGQCA